MGSASHDRAILITFAILIAALPVVAVLAHRGYGPILLLMGLIAATRAEPWVKGPLRFLRPPRRDDPLAQAGLASLVFGVWLLASTFWSPAEGAFKNWSNFAFGLLAAGVVVFEIERRSARENEASLLSRTFVIGVVIAVLLLAFEAASGGLLRRLIPPEDPSPNREKDLIALARGVTALIPSLFAVGAILAGRSHRPPLIFAGLFLVTLYAAAALSVTTNVAALLAGALAGFVGLRHPRLMLRAVALSIAAIFLFAPLAAFLPVEALLEGPAASAPASWQQRLFIWREGGRLALSCLPFGCGADYARHIWSLGEMARVPNLATPVPIMPLHPHNAFLQIWMDLGVVGVGAFMTACLAGAQALARSALTRTALAAAAAIMAATIVSALLEASLWQVWRIAAVGVGAAGVALADSLRSAQLSSWGRGPIA